MVNDAHTILAALDGDVLDDVQAEAVGLLALVAGQDVEPGDSDGTWRIAQVTRPDRIVSVVDAESRHVHKTTSNYRDGFSIDDFIIDTAAGIVTCPNGTTTRISARGSATFGAKCRGCPIRERCTTAANGRIVNINEHHHLLAAARAHASQLGQRLDTGHLKR